MFFRVRFDRTNSVEFNLPGVSQYFGVSKRSKNFFRRLKKKVRTKKNYVPFFVILTFGRLFSLRKYSENFLCLLYVYRFSK
jgi:hypothetical protein